MSTLSSRPQSGSTMSGQREEVTSSSCLSGTKQTWKRNGVADCSQSYIMNETLKMCQGPVSQRCIGEMGVFFFVFFGVQANHDRGRRAESQRVERHVHRDQCQDGLQCQTGDSRSPPTCQHIWSTSLPLLVMVKQMWVYTTHINTTWLLQADLLGCSSTKLS